MLVEFCDAEAPEYLAAFKSLTSVQLLPFQSSVFAFGGGVPPKANAAVEVPEPPKLSLAVFTSVVSVQLVPFHNSTFVTGLLLSGPIPVTAKPAVLSVPARPMYLPV